MEAQDIISVFVPFILDPNDPLIDQVHKKLKKVQAEEEGFHLQAKHLDLQMSHSRNMDQKLFRLDQGQLHFLGDCTSSYEYQGLQDLVYKPIVSDQHINSTLDTLISGEFHQQSLDTSLYQDVYMVNRFTRACYQNITKANFIRSDLNTINKTKQPVNKVYSTIYFDQPLPQAISTPPSSLQTTLHTLLTHKPIWLKAQLENQVHQTNPELSKNLFKGVIKCCAYDFKDGPWKQCYIRHGYDPRQDRMAVNLQVLCIKTNRVEPKLAEIQQQLYFYQLQEITHPEVKAILEECRQEQEGRPCSAKYGWLRQAQHKEIYKKVKDEQKAQKYNLILEAQ